MFCMRQGGSTVVLTIGVLTSNTLLVLLRGSVITQRVDVGMPK